MATRARAFAQKTRPHNAGELDKQLLRCLPHMSHVDVSKQTKDPPIAASELPNAVPRTALRRPARPCASRSSFVSCCRETMIDGHSTFASQCTVPQEETTIPDHQSNGNRLVRVCRSSAHTDSQSTSQFSSRERFLVSHKRTPPRNAFSFCPRSVPSGKRPKRCTRPPPRTT